MTMRQKTRLAVASAAVLGLGVGGMVAVWAADASAGCSWSDPSGDAQTGDGSTSDPDLDLTRLSFASGQDGSVLLTAKVKTLGDTGPDTFPGDEFEFDFTMNDKSFVVGAVRTKSADGGDPQTSAYVLVDGDDRTSDAPSLTPTFEPADSTVQVSISPDDLGTLAGGSADGAVLSDLGSVSYARADDGSSSQADDATADTATWTVGADSCDGQSASEPDPQATDTPDPQATDTPDPQATDDPTSDPEAESSPAGPVLLDQPTPGCTLLTDIQGDADPVPVAGAPSTGKDADVDLRSVTLKTLPESLVAFVKVDRLADKPASYAYKGHRFIVSFAFNNLTVAFRADAAGPAVGTLGGAASPDLSASALFDTARSQVVFTISRDALYKATRSKVADGKKLSGMTAKSQVLLQGYGAMSSIPPQVPAAPTQPPTEQPVDADTASGSTPAQQSYTVGDNRCFYAEGDGPTASPKATVTSKAPSLTVTAPSRVQWSDLAAVAVTLKSGTGKALSGKTVTGRLGAGRIVSGKTDGSGRATLKVPATDPAGSRTLVVSFAGDSTNTAKQVRQSVPIVVEGVKLTGKGAGTGTSYTFTATLTDDDVPTATPQAGQAVVFAYSGKSVTVKTDASGRASIKVAAGTGIQVSYAGRSGYLAPAKIQTRA